MSAARREFGTTWWGRAWLDALEGRAVHDPNRLPRGRTYARQGRATGLAVEPGRVRAQVWGGDDEPYDVLLQIRTFRPDEWECVLDTIAASAAHAAALLDGELEPGIVAATAAVDVELLPRSGELRTACSCPDWAEPCKHAAAVCYLVADVLDADPFALLLLRGMHRSDVLAAVRARRATAATGAPPADDAGSPGDPTGAAPAAGPGPRWGTADLADLVLPGVDAATAWAAPAVALPVAPHPPPAARPPAAWPSDPPADAPFTAVGLRRLALDAAARAWALRTGDDDTALDLDRPADLARRAAGLTEPARRALAERAGTTDALLSARAAAWALAGPDGLRVLDEPSWSAPVAAMVEARDRLLELGAPAHRVRVRADRVTVGGQLQLRRSRDGRWYRLEKQSGRWVLTAPPATEVDELLGPEVDLGR